MRSPGSVAEDAPPTKPRRHELAHAAVPTIRQYVSVLLAEPFDDGTAVVNRVIAIARPPGGDRQDSAITADESAPARCTTSGSSSVAPPGGDLESESTCRRVPTTSVGRTVVGQGVWPGAALQPRGCGGLSTWISRPPLQARARSGWCLPRRPSAGSRSSSTSTRRSSSAARIKSSRIVIVTVRVVS